MLSGSGVALRLEDGSPLPSVHLDSERMAQVLDNLVLNALRYTPQGGEIVLSARQASDQYVEILVRDNGSGIACG